MRGSRPGFAVMWRNWLEFGPEESPQLLEGQVALRTIRSGALFCTVSAAFFAVLYAWRGPVEFSLPHVVAAVFLFVVAVLPTRTPTLPLYLAITFGLLLFGYQLVLLGRIDNGITLWFLVPISAALLLGMRRLATYCIALSAAEILGVVGTARLGWLQPQVVIPEADLVMAISFFGVMTLVGLFSFITLRARKLLMQALENRNAELEAALEAARLARNEAVEASQAKERFFANLTHEIRTPLTGIAGTAELLQQTALSAEQRPLIQALGSSTRNLAELVNAMLDHAKMRAGHVGVELAPLRLRDLARDVEGLFAARAADKRLGFEVAVSGDAPEWVETDLVKLRQILGNLVGNAIKFTSRGAVTVRIRCNEGKEGLRLIVVVADTGIGIPPERIQSVFEPFVQGDSSITRSHGGTGLGLAIARQMAELLGGSLRVDSRHGEGTIFTLDLPVVTASPPQAIQPEPVPAAALAGPFCVLLAEDNKVNQLVARAMLGKLDAAVEVAEDGEQAVGLAETGGFQAILMDLQMPGMDGIAAAAEIRRREERTGRPRVPIIAMTGNSPDDYGAACAEAGMDGFIMKPVRLEELRSLLAGLRQAH